MREHVSGRKRNQLKSILEQSHARDWGDATHCKIVIEEVRKI